MKIVLDSIAWQTPLITFVHSYGVGRVIHASQLAEQRLLPCRLL